MGSQRQIKTMRRVVNKQQNKVIMQYMKNHWDIVLRSTVSLIQTFKFALRFRLAMRILFVGKRRKAQAAADVAD